MATCLARTMTTRTTTPLTTLIPTGRSEVIDLIAVFFFGSGRHRRVTRLRQARIRPVDSESGPPVANSGVVKFRPQRLATRAGEQTHIVGCKLTGSGSGKKKK